MEDCIVRRREGFIEADVEGELVGLDVESGTCYGFNSTATRVWALLEEPKRVSELKDALLAEYDVEPETCEAQLTDLLKTLEADGLVELRREPGPQ